MVTHLSASRILLFADLNLRNDVSSTLPADNNSYLYGGVSASFVFTELLKIEIFYLLVKFVVSAGRVVLILILIKFTRCIPLTDFTDPLLQ
jgi:hypothetical protein